MKSKIKIPKAKVKEFCRKNHILSFSFFGSVLRDDFKPDSDVDVLVEFEPDYRIGLLGLAGLELELSELLGRKVDLVEKKAVEKSQNYIRRKHILNSLEAVYVAG